MDNRQFEPHTYIGDIEGNSKGITRFIKKIIRKCINWYLYSWGIRQNDFNQSVSTAVNDIINENEQFKTEINQILHNIEEVKRQIDELQKQNNELRNLSNQNQDALRIINAGNGKAHSVYNSDKITIGIDNTSILKYIQDKDKYLLETDLAKLNGMIKQDICIQLQEKANRRTIVLMCENLNENRDAEAIRKEIFVIYKRLSQQSKYNVQMVSLEKGDVYKEDGDIAYVGENRMINYLARFQVAVIVWNCPAFLYAHSAHGVFKKYVTLFRFTNQNPLQLNEDLTQEYYRKNILPLCHLNDLGFLSVMVLSKKAKEILKEAGFKNVMISAPQLDETGISYKQHSIKTGSRFKVGFASSPMQEQQMEDRGIAILIEAAQECQNTEFILLWRNEELELPAALKACANINMRYGKQDMQQFYDEIDCLLIPYQNYDNNHACSFSAIEAMLAGVPVVATQNAGVADYVKRCGMGIVTEAAGKEIANACIKMQKHYMEYCQHEKRELLQIILQDNLLDEVERIADIYRPDNIVTLDEWAIMASQKENDLVIGQDEIKRYYSQFEVAEHYNDDRFMTYPENCFDIWERCTIQTLIERKAKGNQLEILDIAPGDGRILQEDIKYGNCVGMDASEAMLNLVRERFADSERLKTVEGDYFTDEIEQSFDIITTFRYIRHFTYLDRQKLYRKIRSNLKQDGVLIFDVPNIKYECEQRAINGWGHFNIYDMFWSKEGITSELQQNGFRVDCMIEVGNGLTAVNGEPMTWTIAAIKN